MLFPEIRDKVGYMIKEAVTVEAQFVRSLLHSLVGFGNGIIQCCAEIQAKSLGRS